MADLMGLLDAFSEGYNLSDPKYRQQVGLLKKQEEIQARRDERTSQLEMSQEEKKLILRDRLEQMQEQRKLELEKANPTLFQVVNNGFGTTSGFDRFGRKVFEDKDPEVKQAKIDATKSLNEYRQEQAETGRIRATTAPPARPKAPPTPLEIASKASQIATSAFNARKMAIPTRGQAAIQQAQTFNKALWEEEMAKAKAALGTGGTELDTDLMNEFNQD